MNKSHLPALFVLLLVAACKAEPTDVQVDVASVTLSPASPTVEVGLTVQFTASAFDASGSPVSGQSVTWESTSPSVATVGATGVATGVTPGSTEIRATVGDVTASETLTVQPTPCTVRTDVVLSPGEHMTVPGNECLLLPAGSIGDLYRVAIARPTLIADSTNTPPVTLSITQVAVAVAAEEAAGAPVTAPTPQAALARDDLPKISASQVLEHLRWQDATRRFHNELRRRERALGLTSAALLPDRAGPLGAPPALLNPPPPITRDAYLDPSCTQQTKQPVTLVSFSENLAVYQETAERDTAAISVTAADELIAYYDSYVKDMIEDYWGPLPDTDADGRVTVVTSPDLGDNVAAAVFSADFFEDGTSICRSNEGEYIYFSGEAIRSLDDDNYFALGVVAHEAKHVISLYNGIERGDLDGTPPSFHDLWIEEGTAEVSQVMSSRIAWATIGGPAPNERVTATELIQTYQANGGQVPPQMSAVVDELAGLVYALSAQPNSLVTDPTGAPEEHSFYLSSWHWHRFLGDAFGNASDAPFTDATFFRTLTNPTTPAGGASGEILLTGRSFEQLFEDFIVAVSFQGTPYSPTYPIDTWDLVSATGIFSNPNPDGDYPWPVTATEIQQNQNEPPTVTQWAPFASDSYTTPIGPSGVRFHDFRSSGTAGAQIQVTGSNVSCDGDGGARCDVIIVSRLD